MKSYDETVSTVFDRIHAYNVKKQHRTVLARRITASCCAVSLLGGSLWYLNHTPEDAPVTMITDGNADTATTTVRNNTFASSATATETQDTLSTTAPVTAAPSGSTTESKTKAPSTTITTTPTQTTAAPSVSTTRSATESTTATTTPQKILITAEGPDNYTVDGEFWSNQEKYISFALEKAMEEYKDANVLYAVVVSVIMTDYDYSHGKAVAEQDPEVIRLAEEKKIAFDAYLEAMEKFFGDRWNEEVRAKRQVFDEIADQYFQLYHKIAGEYVAKTILLPRVDALTEFSKTKPLPLSADMDFLNESLLNTAINIGGKDSFYVELTADAISELANRGGYVFWLASFDNETGFFPGMDNE